MTDQSNIGNRETGPLLDADERPASSAKRWAILIGFAAVLFVAAASVNHRTEKADEPPAAAAAKQEPPGSTNAVLPPGAAPTKSGG